MMPAGALSAAPSRIFSLLAVFVVEDADIDSMDVAKASSRL